MSEAIIYLGSFVTLGFLLLSIWFFLRGRDTALTRLRTSGVDTHETIFVRKIDPNSKMLKLLKPFQDKIATDDDKTQKRRANFLISAGFYSGAAQTIFYATRITLAIMFSTGLATALMLSSAALQPLTLIAVVTLAATIGYYLPLIYVTMRIKERKRKFADGLPDAMDMILICLESGLSFPASLKHVAKELAGSHPVVSEQFQIATLEFQAGRKRAEALKNLADRVDLPDVYSITTMIIQSDILGTSLTRALNAASEDMRRDRMLRAEEKANALPAKMSVPLVLCIFPTLLAIIMVPVMVRIIRVL